MLTYHKVKQGTQEWHALRVRYPHTASLAYVLLTKGKRAASNTIGSHASGYWAQRGHDLEPKAIQVYEAVEGVTAEEIGFITNDDYPDCGYSPDQMIMKYNRPLEVKCFKEEKHLACLDGDIPNEVICQIQFGMMISEADMIPLINYNPDIEDSRLCYKMTPIYRDEQIIKRFKEKLYGGSR